MIKYYLKGKIFVNNKVSIINESHNNNKYIDIFLNIASYIDYNYAILLLSCKEWNGLFKTINTNTFKKNFIQIY